MNFVYNGRDRVDARLESRRHGCRRVGEWICPARICDEAEGE